MRVKAYKDRNSIRVTVPKSIYAQFAEISERLCASKIPTLELRTRVLTRFGDDEPYFSNCDFGLALYVGSPSFDHTGDVRQYGKTSLGFNINGKSAALFLDLTVGNALECEILENTRPEPDIYHDKIIGYTVIRQDGQT